MLIDLEVPSVVYCSQTHAQWMACHMQTSTLNCPQILGHERGANIRQWLTPQRLQEHHSNCPQRVTPTQPTRRTCRHHQVPSCGQVIHLFAWNQQTYGRLHNVVPCMHEAAIYSTSRASNNCSVPQGPWKKISTDFLDGDNNRLPSHCSLFFRIPLPIPNVLWTAVISCLTKLFAQQP